MAETTYRPHDGKVRPARPEPHRALVAPSRREEAASHVRRAVRDLQPGQPGDARTVDLLALTDDLAHTAERDRDGGLVYVIQGRTSPIQFQLRIVSPDHAEMIAAAVSAFADELRKVQAERLAANPSSWEKTP